MVEGRNRDIDPFATSVIFKKKRRPATAGKRANAIRVIHLSHFTVKNLHPFATERTPGDQGRTAGAPAIYAMAIA